MARWSIARHAPERSKASRQTDPHARLAGTGRVKPRLLIMSLAIMAAVATALAPSLLWPPSAKAADFSVTQMKVSVWPEYDDPRVLVINQADLDPSVQLPANVSFNIPKGAEIGMACEVDPGGGHACKTYQLADRGDYLTLTYKIEAQRKIFLEYYYEAYPAGTPTRSFDFTFRPAFAAKSLELEVQKPLRSSEFVLDPAFTQTFTDSQGLAYYAQNYSDVSVDGPMSVKVSYTKTDDDPSVPKAQTVAQVGTESPGSSTGGGNTAVYVVVGALAFGGILFGGYKKLRPAAAQASRSGRGSPARKRNDTRNQGSARKGSVKSEPNRPSASNERYQKDGTGGADKRRRTGGQGVKFCPDCGAKLPKQHRYCSQCGIEQP